MSFQTRHVVGFTVVVTIALAGIMALPRAREGVEIERTTGRSVSAPWRGLTDLRQKGDLALLAAGIRELAKTRAKSEVVIGLEAMIEHEAGKPDFDADVLAAAPVEAYFAGVDAPDGIDARAAMLQRRLAAGGMLPSGQMLALAARFRQLGRHNSQWRWLSRALACYPDSTVAADGLIALGIANGRLDQAMQVIERHTADRSGDLAWQRRMAQIGAWTSNPELEARALEHIVQLSGDPLDRGRLIALYSHLGTPERALTHAVAIADSASEIATAEEAAATALSEGFTDEGLAMLERAAQRAPVASPWLAKYAELALQDLRIPEVREALETAAEVDPALVDASLEDLYRRTDQPAKLADLLQNRIGRRPADVHLWNELITLRSALGQRDEARMLADQRDAALADPESFVAKLPEELRARAGALRTQALALSMANTADGTIVGETLEQLRPFLVQPEFRNLAELLLAQHPDDPRAKSMRRELVDYGRTPIAAERAASALSTTYPDDPDLVRFWLERAQWADLVPAQIRARRRLLALAPNDLDNRFELADLLEFAGDNKAALPHWRHIAAAEGLQSRAVPRLIEALFALGSEDDAVAWLQRLAEDPKATTAQRLEAADQLFYRRSYDRARVMYAAVLSGEPAHARALLRMGQISAWTNDPRSALDYFRRRLEATPDDGALVRFYLGEALWALGESGAAREAHEQALAAYREVENPDNVARSCIATMLARLGHHDEAIAAYRDLVARSPRNVDIVLDYAEIVLERGDLGVADALARHAFALAPSQPRVLRLQGAVAARSGDFVAADRAYEKILEQVGSDAAVLGDQSQLRLEAGNWDAAHESAVRWLEVQPESVAAQRTEHEVRELLASFAVADVWHRRIGRDRMTSAAIGGAMMLSERTWLQGRLAAVSQRGATSLGSGEATADYTRLEAAFGMRPGRSDRLVFGVSAAPGAEGDTPVGLFAAGHFEWQEPAVSLQLRARWHELWTDSMAAAGLGGRQSGVEAVSYVELGRGYWASVHGGIDWLELDPELSPSLGDMRWRGEASLGVRLVDGDVAVAGRFDPLTIPTGPDSPFLAASPEFTRPWLCNAWVGWQSAHLLGDAALTTALPLVARDDNATAAVRVDHHLARTLGLSATGYTGLDMRGGGSIYGIEASLTWRPAFGSEITLVGSRGEALGRTDGSVDEQLRLQVVLRW